MNIESEFSDGASAQHPRWMVVDDNPGILQIFSNFLAMISDAEINCYESGEAALQAIQDEPGRVSVVITDLEMPGMNGIEFQKRLHGLAPQIKVLLTTGNQAAIDESSARLIGFQGLLYKPFSVAALKKTLEEVGAYDCEAETHQVARSVAS